jgi:hypothetical protein
MPPVGFEPAIPASKRPQTYALDRAATGEAVIYACLLCKLKIKCSVVQVLSPAATASQMRYIVERRTLHG